MRARSCACGPLSAHIVRSAPTSDIVARGRSIDPRGQPSSDCGKLFAHAKCGTGAQAIVVTRLHAPARRRTMSVDVAAYFPPDRATQGEAAPVHVESKVSLTRGIHRHELLHQIGATEQ